MNEQNKEQIPTTWSEQVPTTWPEMMDNLRKLMNDPKAQKKWAEELDKKGLGVNFNGPIPSIFSKEIYITSSGNDKETNELHDRYERDLPLEE